MVTFYSDTISMVLGRYEDKFYRTTAIEIEPQEFTLEILDSDSRITVMTGGKATWDGMDVQVIPRYVPSEVGCEVQDRWYNNVRRNSIKKGDEF